MEIYREYLTNNARQQEMLNLGSWWRIAVIKSYPQSFPSFLNGIDNFLTLSSGNGHWFLADNVTTHIHCAADIVIVVRIFSSNDHHLWLLFPDHPIKIRREIPCNL